MAVSRRRPAPVAALLSLALCSAAPLAATEHPLEASFLIAPERDSESYAGVVLDRFWGLGLAWHLSAVWAVEARGQFQEGTGDFLEIAIDGYDLGVRRAFASGGRWRPYLAAGAHVRDTEVLETVACLDVTLPCPPLRESDDGRGGFVGAGVDWSFLRRAALRFDGRYRAWDSSRLGGTETEATLAVGLALRF